MAHVLATTRLIKLYYSENNHLHIFNMANRKMDFQQETELILLIIPFIFLVSSQGLLSTI